MQCGRVSGTFKKGAVCLFQLLKNKGYEFVKKKKKKIPQAVCDAAKTKQTKNLFFFKLKIKEKEGWGRREDKASQALHLPDRGF